MNLMHEINKVNPKLHHELKLIPSELLNIKYGMIFNIFFKLNLNSNKMIIIMNYYQILVIININNNY